MRKYILENDALSEETYSAYVKVLPRRFKVFPQQLSAAKTKILVEQNTITFSATNLLHLSDDPTLGIAFVTRNIAEFFEAEGECDLADDFRQNLLEADIGDENRLKIIQKMDLSLLADISSRAAIVGRILARTGVKIDNLGVDAARAVIVNSQPLSTQITLLSLIHI